MPRGSAHGRRRPRGARAVCGRHGVHPLPVPGFARPAAAASTRRSSGSCAPTAATWSAARRSAAPAAASPPTRRRARRCCRPCTRAATPSTPRRQSPKSAARRSSTTCCSCRPARSSRACCSSSPKRACADPTRPTIGSASRPRWRGGSTTRTSSGTAARAAVVSTSSARAAWASTCAMRSTSARATGCGRSTPCTVASTHCASPPRPHPARPTATLSGSSAGSPRPLRCTQRSPFQRAAPSTRRSRRRRCAGHAPCSASAASAPSAPTSPRTTRPCRLSSSTPSTTTSRFASPSRRGSRRGCGCACTPTRAQLRRLGLDDDAVRAILLIDLVWTLREGGEIQDGVVHASIVHAKAQIAHRQARVAVAAVEDEYYPFSVADDYRASQRAIRNRDPLVEDALAHAALAVSHVSLQQLATFCNPTGRTCRRGRSPSRARARARPGARRRPACFTAFLAEASDRAAEAARAAGRSRRASRRRPWPTCSGSARRARVGRAPARSDRHLAPRRTPRIANGSRRSRSAA